MAPLWVRPPPSALPRPLRASCILARPKSVTLGSSRAGGGRAVLVARGEGGAWGRGGGGGGGGPRGFSPPGGPPPPARQQDVGRLEVAVDDAVPVGVVDGPGQHLHQLRCRPRHQGLALEA